MPVLVIAVIVILAIGAGAYFFSAEETSTPTVEREVEITRPETTSESDADQEIETESEPDPVVDTNTEIDTVVELSTPATESAAVSEIVDPEPEPVTAPAGEFADGSYSTNVSYLTPSRSSHSMDITFTLENDIVVASSIIYDDGDGPSNSHHRRFDAAYKSEVVGMQLDEISLSRVGGASLTSASFNEAVANVEAEARS